MWRVILTDFMVHRIDIRTDFFLDRDFSHCATALALPVTTGKSHAPPSDKVDADMGFISRTPAIRIMNTVNIRGIEIDAAMNGYASYWVV